MSPVRTDPLVARESRRYPPHPTRFTPPSPPEIGRSRLRLSIRDPARPPTRRVGACRYPPSPLAIIIALGPGSRPLVVNAYLSSSRARAHARGAPARGYPSPLAMIMVAGPGRGARSRANTRPRSCSLEQGTTRTPIRPTYFVCPQADMHPTTGLTTSSDPKSSSSLTLRLSANPHSRRFIKSRRAEPSPPFRSWRSSSGSPAQQFGSSGFRTSPRQRPYSADAK